MKLKSEQGISLISLGIAIIIMILIAGTLIYNTMNNFEIRKIKDLYSDIDFLNTKVSEYYSTYGNLPLLKEYTGDLSKISGDVKNPNDGKAYYIIDLNSIENISLNYGKGFEEIKSGKASDDIYIINKDSQTIYYIKGIEYEGKMIYRDGTKYSYIMENLKYIDENGDTSIIPEGFNISEKTDEQTIKDGLVIIDKDNGNEFVWIPVDGTNVKYEKWTPSGTSHTSTTDDTLPHGVADETHQITEYGGFYIARYEAGIPESMTDAINTLSAEKRNVPGVPISKKNSVPWNCINYTKAKSNAENMYKTSSVQSGLVTGTQWDTMIKWLQNSGKDVTTDSSDWGNFVNSTVLNITSYSSDYGATWSTDKTDKPSGSYWLLKTGNSEYAKVKNIYNVAGNLTEWSNEIYSSTRASRGGNYYYNSKEFPAGHRLVNGASDTYFTIGFRSVLYIK